MLSIVPFNQHDADAVLAFWQSLHPDLAWLRDHERVADAFTKDEDEERDNYLVRSDQSVIATVFTECVRRPGWLPVRFVHIETRAATLGWRWLRQYISVEHWSDATERFRKSQTLEAAFCHRDPSLIVSVKMRVGRLTN